MSKVQLSVTYRRRTDSPITPADTRAEHVCLDVPSDWGLPEVTAVSFKEVVPATDEPRNFKTMQYSPLYGDTSRLVGKIKTYIDATFTDPQQRKAHKDIVEQVVWAWRKELHDRAATDISRFTNTEIDSTNTIEP